MGNTRLVRSAGSRLAIQTILENGMQGCVGTRIDLKCSLAGCFEAIAAKGFSQPQNTQARPVSLFGMAPLTHDNLNIDFGVGADACGLPADAFGCPVCFEPVVGGHVIFMGGMRLPDERTWAATRLPLKYTSTVRAVIRAHSFCFNN